ncbi:hypothetical protein J3R74_001677 [Puniceicoccus vermicola]
MSGGDFTIYGLYTGWGNKDLKVSHFVAIGGRSQD